MQRGGAGEEVERLEDEPDFAVADPRELARRQASDIFAVQEVAAAGGGVETTKNVHEGGLPRAGGTHDRDELATRDPERQAADRVNCV